MTKGKIIVLALGLSFALFVFPSTAFAVTLTITSSPSTISNEEFTVGVDIVGPNPGTNYLRVDLFKDGTPNYFGETFNGSSWYLGSSGTQYFPVTISSESTASAQVRARLGNPSSSDYLGPGAYKLKVRRYTSSGNQASDDQNPADIQITYVSSTVAPTTAPTSAPTTAPTSAPTQAPTTTPKPTIKATATPKPKSPSPTPDGEETPQPDILGMRQELEISPTPIENSGLDAKKFPLIAGVFILGGVGFMGSAVYMFIANRENHKRKLVDESIVLHTESE